MILIGVASVVFGIAFRQEIIGAVRVWIDSTAYNHCFLVLPLAGFLLWERRAVISSVSPHPALWPLLTMPALSAVWFLAAVLDIQEGRQLVMVAMFQVVLLVALGPRVFWQLLAPFLFLFFLVPSGAFLVPSLQTITADIAVAGLRFFNIPVFSDGYMIEIPEGPFEIAEACAGLRFLIASGVFGCFFAVVMYRSFLRRILFIIMSVSVPIVANGLRALGIIVLAHLEGSAAAVEADHVLYGWLFFTLVIMILIALGMAFAEKPGLRPPTRSTTMRKLSLWRLAVAVSAAVLLAVTGPAYAYRLDSLFPAAQLPRGDSPHVGPSWHSLSGTLPNWRPLVHGADREFLEGFEQPGADIVVRYVALYRLHAIGNMLTTTENRLADDGEWRIAERGETAVSLGGEKITATSAEIVSGPRRRLVWSFYIVDGRVSARLLEAKLLQARAVLLRRAPVAALVAISASMDDPGNPAEGQLARFLAASQSLPRYVDSLRPVEAEPGV
ncbi:MAG: EpsI family protein [Alphaproteobacteria bacterium]|nr:EpsI family protein [Alphaproteobacteria bacterium]